MKRRIVFLVVAALVLSLAAGFSGMDVKTVSAANTFQKVDVVDAKVTANYLNVRQGPSENFEVVCVLKKGQTVKIFGKIGNWYAIYEPATNCVGVAHSSYLQAAGAQKPAPQKQPAKTTAKPKPTAAPKSPEAQKPEPTKDPMIGISDDERLLLDLINKERTKAGLDPLQFDVELMKVARLKAKDMVDNNYFAHQSPTYGSPFDMMRQFGVSFNTAGENIAGNQTLEGAVKAWMDSEGHRKNILSGKYNYTGIGIVESPIYGKVLVQQFIGK